VIATISDNTRHEVERLCPIPPLTTFSNALLSSGVRSGKRPEFEAGVAPSPDHRFRLAGKRQAPERQPARNLEIAMAWTKRRLFQPHQQKNPG